MTDFHLSGLRSGTIRWLIELPNDGHVGKVDPAPWIALLQGVNQADPKDIAPIAAISSLACTIHRVIHNFDFSCLGCWGLH